MKLLILLLCGTVLNANNVEAGRAVGEAANARSENIKQGGAGQMGIPLQTPSVPNDHDSLVQASNAKKQSEEFQMIKSSYEKMPLIEVEPHNPFDQNGNSQKRTVKTTVQKTCFESGETYTQTCKKHRLISLQLIPEVRTTHRSCPGHEVDYVAFRGIQFGTHQGEGERIEQRTEYCNPGCVIKDVLTQARSVSVISEQWAGCEELESLEDTPQGEVSVEVASVIQGPPETRHLEARCPTKVEQEPIWRDSWEQTYTYQVTPKPCHDCEVLKAEGCRQVNAVCVSEITTEQGLRLCLKWQKIYDCDVFKTETDDLSNLKSSNLITPISSTPNGNMYKALAQLEGLKQMSQQKEGDPIISIFKGQDSRCSINFGGAFKNCCTKSGGWGASSGLGTKCTADENALQKANADKRCIYLGTRIKSKTLGVVTSKEQVYCCYPSKIARAIQEGAKRQLGLTFGSADSPECRGLTPEELERVDFSLIDLSEAYADIAASAQKMSQELKTDFAQKQQSLQTKEGLEATKAKQQGGQSAL